MNLQGKVAIVTGAAGGVGWAIVEKLAKSNCQVICIARRNIDQIEKKLKKLSQNNLVHHVYQADVTDSNSLVQVRDQLIQCDILVNCAGKTQAIPHHDMESLTDAVFDQMMVDNLRGTFATIRTFLPLLQSSSDALIVNIGSSSAQGDGGSNLAYACAKAGIECLTRKLAAVIAPVRILTVCPGGLETNFVPRPQNFSQQVAEVTPLGRIGTVEDVADAVLSCVIGMKFATGQSFLVDGGRTT